MGLDGGIIFCDKLYKKRNRVIEITNSELPLKYTSIEVTIGKRKIKILNRFGLKICRKFIEQCEKTNDFRSEFINAVYEMYSDNLIRDVSDCNGTSVSETEFLKIEDTQLMLILNAILEKDPYLFELYNKIECENPYGRFYLVIKRQIENLSETLKKSFQINIDINVLKEITAGFKSFGSVFANVQSNLTDALKELIPKINISLKPFFDALATIDFGKLHLIGHLRECHNTLISFGWWYLNDIDEQLLNKIFENKDIITKQEVDRIICDYFRANRCEKLKNMTKGWKQLPYFKARAIDVHQIVIIHGQKYYNSSVTLLTIMIEGVTRDFVQSHLGQGFYKFSKVREELRNIVENDDNIGLFEYTIADHILKCVEETFSGGFNPATPEESPDYKRDKRLHGQALEKQCEADSLKLFLQLNELYNIFYLTGNQTDNSECQ